MLDMIHFDTLKYVETLRASGVPETQAHAFSKAQQQVIAECIETSLPNTLATKADIRKVELTIDKLELTTKARFDKLETRISHVERDISSLKSDMKWTKWMIGAILAGLSPLIIETMITTVKRLAN